MRLILALSVLVSLAQSYKSYDGHQVKQHSRERSEQTTEMIQVLRTTQLDITASDLLREVMLEADLDFWKEPAPGKSADILVSEAQMSSVTAWLKSHGIGYSIMVENVQR